MDEVLDQVGSAVGDVLSSAPVQLVVLGTILYATLVWLATAHWVLRDMRRRRDDPVSPYVAAIAIVLASPVLLPIAALTYLVLRPRETVAEARERQLSERLEALAAEMALACPGCRRPVEDDWLTCPACRTRLARRCLTCGRTMGLDWSLCGFCGAEFGRPVVAQRLPVAVRGGLPEPRRAAADGERTRAPTRPASAAAAGATRPVDRDRPADHRREVLEPNA